MLPLSLWYQFIWPTQPLMQLLQCLFQTPKDWDGENVMVLPSCYHVTEIAHLKFQGPPSLLSPGFLLTTLQVQIQSVTGTHFSRKRKKSFWKSPLIKIIYLECFETQKKKSIQRGRKNHSDSQPVYRKKNLTNVHIRNPLIYYDFDLKCPLKDHMTDFPSCSNVKR